MIKVTVYDYDNMCYKDIFTNLSSRKFWKKYCNVKTDRYGKNHGYLFICWSSKKHNFNCWHYSIGLNLVFTNI